MNTSFGFRIGNSFASFCHREFDDGDCAHDVEGQEKAENDVSGLCLCVG